MKNQSPPNLELTVVLPLGAIANQLMKVEADLRFVNMKVVSLANDADGGDLTRQLTVRLDDINLAMDRIRGLLSDMEADVRPRSRRTARASQQDD